MSEVKPVHMELSVAGSPAEVGSALLKQAQALNGRLVRSEANAIECDFGSLLVSRLVGEFWVPKSTLPKKAVIGLQAAAAGGTLVVLDIHDTHRFGYKLGYVGKYEAALQELAEALISAIENK